MEWMHAAGNTWFVDLKDALAAICLTGRGEAVLIDSGREERQELLTGLEARGLRVRAVLCTHLHRDHTANNLLLHTRPEQRPGGGHPLSHYNPGGGGRQRYHRRHRF